MRKNRDRSKAEKIYEYIYFWINWSLKKLEFHQSKINQIGLQGCLQTFFTLLTTRTVTFIVNLPPEMYSDAQFWCKFWRSLTMFPEQQPKWVVQIIVTAFFAMSPLSWKTDPLLPHWPSPQLQFSASTSLLSPSPSRTSVKALPPLPHHPYSKPLAFYIQPLSNLFTICRLWGQTVTRRN